MYLLICSYILDLIFGDPEWLPHPVKWIGGLIHLLDKRLRGKDVFWVERIKGMLLAFLVIGISTACAYFVIVFFREISPFFGNLIWIYLAYTTIAIKDLRDKAKAVLSEIENGSVKEARHQLSRIVGRDTQELSKDKIIKAVIESVSESVNDGIIAPLFYLILGGPVLAIAYKSVNTLDSMVGYKNEKYFNFGWFSAKLDDVLSYIPARISGFLIAVSSGFYNRNFIVSFKTMIKDGRNHFSPNSGVSEAAMAGALGIRLGGTASYFGKVLEKPYIGEKKSVIEASLITKALNISFIASFLMLLAGVILKWII